MNTKEYWEQVAKSLTNSMKHVEEEIAMNVWKSQEMQNAVKASEALTRKQKSKPLRIEVGKKYVSRNYSAYEFTQIVFYCPINDKYLGVSRLSDSHDSDWYLSNGDYQTHSVSCKDLVAEYVEVERKQKYPLGYQFTSSSFHGIATIEEYDYISRSYKGAIDPSYDGCTEFELPECYLDSCIPAPAPTPTYPKPPIGSGPVPIAPIYATAKKCECGASSVGRLSHSSYCPMHEEDTHV